MPKPQMMKGRTLVLCFDGTANDYDDTNTNVVKLYSLLKKDDRDAQLVYYQPGIGTYANPGVMGSLFLSLAKMVDMAVAWYLDHHVMGGYRFLMQNWRAGDRICLFGFSRGAYTARCLAGMLHKVGLLPRDNEEQVPFAFKMYRRTDPEGTRLARGFKQTFSRVVDIEFVGVWDTVSSVGMLVSRSLPFTSSNHIIRTFRHAIALDERRARFIANGWHKRVPKLDGVLPWHRHDPDGDAAAHHDTASRNNRDGSPSGGTVYKGPFRKETDVEEVWFAGCHCDVGGGNDKDWEANTSLANISLRWMVRECAQAQAGILFDNAALKRMGIPQASFRLSSAFTHFPRRESSAFANTPSPGTAARQLQLQEDQHEDGDDDGLSHSHHDHDHHNKKDSSRKNKHDRNATLVAPVSPPSGESGGSGDKGGSNTPPPRHSRGWSAGTLLDLLPSLPKRSASQPGTADEAAAAAAAAAEQAEQAPVDPWKLEIHELDNADALAPIHDESRRPAWWFLELWPTSSSWQDKDGRWHKVVRPNFLRARHVPSHPRPKVHISVKKRMEQTGYKPRAMWGVEPIWVE